LSLLLPDQALLKSLQGVRSAQIALVERSGAITSANRAWEAAAGAAGLLTSGARAGADLFALLQPELERTPVAQSLITSCRAVLEGESDGFVTEYAAKGPQSGRHVIRGYRVPGYSPARLLLVQEAASVEGLVATSVPEGSGAEDIERAKLLSWVSHELKSPLTAIVAFADILAHNKEKTLTARQLEHLHIIQRNSQRLQGLVNDLLDLTRLQTGNLSLRPSLFDAADLVTEIAESMQPVFAGRRQHLNVTLQAGPMNVRADRDRMAQVLVNLVDNASKYSPPRTEIRLDVVAHDGLLRLTVADRGPGIPPGALPHVFRPFYRVDNEVTRSVPGTGIGLSIVQRIVELHSGHIDIESAPGKGTTVRVSVPVKGGG
jgi:signal transduction histidine kinase